MNRSKNLDEQEHIHLQKGSMLELSRHLSPAEVRRIEVNRHGRNLLIAAYPDRLGLELGIWIDVTPL